MNADETFDFWVLSESRPRNPLAHDAFLAGLRMGRRMLLGEDGTVGAPAKTTSKGRKA